jgi:hypothetical protein
MTTTTSHFTTNDGVRLLYEFSEGGSASSGNSQSDSPVVLVHGRARTFWGTPETGRQYGPCKPI